VKLTCPSAAIIAALRTAGRATSPRATMPILGMLLLDASGNTLRVAGTDLEIGLEASCAATVTEPGRAALPAKLLMEIATTLPDAPVTLETHPETSSGMLACDTVKFELQGMSAEDFPDLPGPDGDTTLRLQADALRTLIQSVAYAPSTDETRPFLTGALLTTQDSVTRMVATDGARLAIASTPLAGAPATPWSMIVPKHGLTELMRILPTTGEVVLAHVGTTLFANTGTVQFRTRLIAGEFPTYQQVVDRAMSGTIELIADRAALIRAVRRVAITSEHSAKAVKFAADNGALVLTANAPAVGSASERLAVQVPENLPVIAFKAGFLLEALEAMNATEVRLTLQDTITPALLRPVGRPEPMAVIAPVRLLG